MSLSPETVPVPESLPPTANHPRNKHRLLLFCFALFTFEVGLFLVIFPWRDNWTFNYFQDATPFLSNIWDDPYFRGAISGLGLVNIFFSIREILSLIRRPR
jgi:hypothetical protein